MFDPIMNAKLLPVLELSIETMQAALTQGQAVCTEKESAIIGSAMNKLTPMIVKASYGGMSAAVVGNIIWDYNEGMSYFEATITTKQKARIVTNGEMATVSLLAL